MTSAIHKALLSCPMFGSPEQVIVMSTCRLFLSTRTLRKLQILCIGKIVVLFGLKTFSALAVFIESLHVCLPQVNLL